MSVVLALVLMVYVRTEIISTCVSVIQDGRELTVILVSNSFCNFLKLAVTFNLKMIDPICV